MAKGNSNRGNAHASPSLTPELLALDKLATPAITQATITIQQMWAENQAFFDPDRKIGYRKPHPEWDNQTERKIKKRLDGDRRQYHPNRHYQPAHSLFAEAIQLRDSLRMPSFKMPNYVSICLRRKVRREVLMAKRFGKGSSKPRRRNAWSGIKC